MCLCSEYAGPHSAASQSWSCAQQAWKLGMLCCWRQSVHGWTCCLSYLWLGNDDCALCCLQGWVHNNAANNSEVSESQRQLARHFVHEVP